jgi:hypothetical protein
MPSSIVESLFTVAALVCNTMEETINTDDVIDSLTESLDAAEVVESDLAGGVRLVVPESEIGAAMGLMRRNGYEFDATRGPSSETLIVNIAAEVPTVDPDQKGLGSLFG